MRYIQLSNDSYILHFSTGLHTLTRKSFHYNKIKKLIEQGADETTILPLLKFPDLPNGIFEAYEDTKTNKLQYIHINPAGIKTVVELKTGKKLSLTEEEEKQLQPFFVGVYTSEEDIIEDWPEYML